ncbi:MAG: hypothetical protein V4686_00795 [Patescibacteria group bacterium]
MNDEEEIDDSFPPYSPLTHVRTVNCDNAPEYTFGEQYKRSWNIHGMVVAETDNSPEWFEVLHDDGTTGHYHYTELKPWRDDDGDGDCDTSPTPTTPRLQTV